MEEFEEAVGQLEMRAHPALARAVREIEVQPDEIVRRGIVRAARAPRGSRVRIERRAGAAGNEAESAHHAGRIGAVSLYDQVHRVEGRAAHGAPRKTGRAPAPEMERRRMPDGHDAPVTASRRIIPSGSAAPATRRPTGGAGAGRHAQDALLPRLRLRGARARGILAPVTIADAPAAQLILEETALRTLLHARRQRAGRRGRLGRHGLRLLRGELCRPASCARRAPRAGPHPDRPCRPPSRYGPASRRDARARPAVRACRLSRRISRPSRRRPSRFWSSRQRRRTGRGRTDASSAPLASARDRLLSAADADDADATVREAASSLTIVAGCAADAADAAFCATCTAASLAAAAAARRLPAQPRP